MGHTDSDLESAAHCTQRKDRQALIAFAVPNPNPASDLTVPPSHSQEQQPWVSACLAFCLAYVWPGAAFQAHGRVCVVRILLGLDVSAYSKAQALSSMV